jgi:hypothetical protein
MLIKGDFNVCVAATMDIANVISIVSSAKTTTPDEISITATPPHYKPVSTTISWLGLTWWLHH